MTDREHQEDKRKRPHGLEEDDGNPLKRQNLQDSEDGQITEQVTELDLISFMGCGVRGEPRGVHAPFFFLSILKLSQLL